MRRNQECTINYATRSRSYQLEEKLVIHVSVYPDCTLLKDSAVPFESTLERDFLIRLEVDPNVLAVESQPFTIEYVDNGKKRVYTPDFLVTYKHDNYLPFIPLN